MGCNTSRRDARRRIINYNFICKHQTGSPAPAVMAGIAGKSWTMVDIVETLESEEKMLGGRLTDYKPAKK